LVAAAGAIGFALGVIAMAMLVVRRRSPPRAAAKAQAAAKAAALLAMALATSGAVVGEAQAQEVQTPTGNGSTTSGHDLSQRLPDGSIFMPKTTQRILTIRTNVTETGRYARVIDMPGRIIADPNASGHVQASVGGRLSAPAGGFPRLGSRVNQGDVLAYVTPPLQAIDVSDMRQRQGELDQQIAIVQRRVHRYEVLAKTNAIPRIQYDEAVLELEGLRDRRAALDKIRREPEALIAPVTGVIAEGMVVAGQMAQPNTVIFKIVDPSRLWIEALSFTTLAPLRTATARTAAGQSFKLSFRGSGFADRSQSIPLHFAIEDNLDGVHVGQFVTVFASGNEEHEGIALPRAAIVRTAAGDVVYEHVSAERFMARPVRFVPLDGERALIVSGLDGGKRIVVQGAELLDQVR
jgi:RND family efflux transporter MFP subunit